MKRRSRYPQKSLPTSIIHQEIFVKLPVKTLLRCRCLSKFWCSVIDESFFASNHFKNFQNNQAKTRLLALEPPNIRDSNQICAIRSGEKYRKMSKFEIDVPRDEKYQAVGYVNGVLCMKKYIRNTQVSKILLWNPSIKKTIELPFYRPPESKDVRYDVDCALGYDHVRNDYKVVGSLYFQNGHRPGYDGIFTLSTFLWKKPNIGRLPCLWIKDGPKVFLNGVIYWGGIYKSSTSDAKGKFSHFVSFDVVNDAFKYIALPDCEHADILEYERFPIILDQFVGLMEIFESYSQIWVLENSKGEVHSWTKRFNIKLQLLGKYIYLKGDGELLFAGEKGGVKSYNIKTQEAKVLTKNSKLARPIFICVYMESLALLKVIPERA